MADFKCVVCKHHYTPSDSPPCDNCEYIGDGRYSAYSPCTNADRIRSMTDEELANCITDDLCDRVCHSPLSCDGNCETQVLAWLKQEAVDNGACLANETSEKVQNE